MANTFGVKYGGSRGYGTSRSSLASLMGGNTSMQPLGSRAPGFQSIQQPISDVLNSNQQANRNAYASVTGVKPGTRNDPASPGTAGVTANGGPSSPANTSPAGPTPTPPPTPPTPPATPPAGFNDTADPILEQIKQAGYRSVMDSNTNALANAKTALINYGSTSVPPSIRDLYANGATRNDPLLGDLGANPIVGALNDQNTSAAALANPFSQLARLSQVHDTNVHGIDNATNLANLYYSSTHANELGQEGQDYLGSQNDAAQTLAGLLGGENQGVLGSIDAAHNSYMQQLPQAYQRWIDAGGPTAVTSPPGGTTPPPGDGTTPPPPDGTPPPTQPLYPPPPYDAGVTDGTTNPNPTYGAPPTPDPNATPPPGQAYAPTPIPPQTVATPGGVAAGSYYGVLSPDNPTQYAPGAAPTPAPAPAYVAPAPAATPSLADLITRVARPGKPLYYA